jgi:hypothetical protein
MKVLVAEQSIDGLDLMLHARNAGEASTQLGKRELPANQQSANDSYEGGCPHGVANHFSIT